MRLVLEYTLKMGNGSNKRTTSAKAACTKPGAYKILAKTLCVFIDETLLFQIHLFYDNLMGLSVNVNSVKCESSRCILHLARTH